MARELAPPRSKMRRLAAADRVAHWRLEETSGGTVVDDAGSSNLTSVVGAANIVEGDFYGAANNRARVFATNQYSTGASSPAQRAALAAEWTIEAWIRPTSLAGVNAIIGHGSNAAGEANNYLASLRLDGAGFGAQWQRTSSKTTVAPTTTTSPMVLNERQHVAGRCRVTGATREVSLFRNGVLLETFAGLDPPTGGASGSWELGALPVSHGSPFDGEIYEVRVSAVALDDDAICESWARGVRDYDLATLYASGSYEVYGRALIADGTGWIDLSDYCGVDWIDAIEWERMVDDQGASGSLTLRREVFDLSMVPMRGGSATNALTTNGELLVLMSQVRLEVAVVPFGTGKDGLTLADWLPVFRGHVVGVDTATDPAKVELFDRAAAIQDVWVEPDRAFTPPRDRSYGTDGGTPVEDELQKILDDNIPPTVGYLGGNPTIWTPVLSAVMVRTWTTAPSKNVLGAIEDVVAQFGWDCGYVWDDLRQQFRFAFTEPPRSTTWATGSPVIDAGIIIERSRLEVRRDDVRNVVEVEYGDEDADHPGTIKRRTVVVSDPTSIARFGRRYCRIGLGSDAQNNDLSGATALANKALSDLAWPLADAETLLPFRHDIDIGDVVKHTADFIHFDTAVVLATVGVRHRLTAGAARTTLVQRGTVPSGKRWKWFDMITLTRGASSTRPPSTPTGLLASAVVGGARVSWDFLPYRGNRRFRETEVYWSTTSGFTPNASTLRERQRGASALSIGGGMTPGTVHYLRAAHVDDMGNTSGFSPQVAVTPRQLPITAHARVRRGTNVTIAAGTYVTVAWNVEDADPLNRHSAGNYTALTAGLLDVDARALLDSAAKPSAVSRLAIFVNGTLREVGDTVTANTGAAPNRAQTRVAATIAVAAGDVVTLRAYCEGNVGTAVVADATNSRAWLTPLTED